MKKILATLLLLSAAALANSSIIPQAQVYWTETQGGVRAAPTLATEGASLSGVTSMHAILQCSDGSNFDGGTCTSYYRSPQLLAWAPAPTSLNFTVPKGGPIAVGPELQVTNPFGRFMYATVGVGCDGASWDGGVLVSLERAQQ